MVSAFCAASMDLSLESLLPSSHAIGDQHHGLGPVFRVRLFGCGQIRRVEVDGFRFQLCVSASWDARPATGALIVAGGLVRRPLMADAAGWFSSCKSSASEPAASGMPDPSCARLSRRTVARRALIFRHRIPASIHQQAIESNDGSMSRVKYLMSCCLPSSTSGNRSFRDSPLNRCRDAHRAQYVNQVDVRP